MRIGKFKVSKRAVSPVIATLLMIAIAVAASVIVYVWSIGLLGGLMGGGGSQAKEQLIMEAYDWGGASPKCVLRNVGSANVTIAAAYISGSAVSGFPTTAIAPGSATASFTLTGFTGTSGTAYTVKFVSKSGGVFTFSMIAGSAG
jgi:flagellin-like protein